MNGFWRIGLAAGLATFFAVSFAYAQSGGTGAGLQTGGAAVGAPSGSNLGGGANQAAQGDPKTKDSKARTLPGVQRRSSTYFDRVSTTRREVAPSAGMGAPGPSHPYSARSIQSARRPGDPQTPTGSSWQNSQRPVSPPPVTIRSTTQNYFPGMRSAQGVNVGAMQADQLMRSRTRRPGARGAGAGAGGANSAASAAIMMGRSGPFGLGVGQAAGRRAANGSR
jgi:hypothetical protein